MKQPIITHPGLMPMLETLRDSAATEGKLRGSKEGFFDIRHRQAWSDELREEQQSFERLSEQLQSYH